jgi:hypothetical protein
MSVILSLGFAMIALFINPAMQLRGFNSLAGVEKKGPKGHNKDCESVDFTKNTMKLLNEEVVMRLSHEKVSNALPQTNALLGRRQPC